MAKPAVSRFDNAPPFHLLTTYESILTTSAEAPNQLIVVLFNTQYPERGTIENRLKNFRYTYEKKNMQFYKCIFDSKAKDMKSKLQIKRTPTFVFFHKGEKVGGIDDLNEGNPDVDPEAAALGEESNDEKRVKAKLDGLYEKYILASQAQN